MPNRTWKERLFAAIDAEKKRSKRSWRVISMAAGLGQNYISEMRSQGKEPLAQNVVDLAEECHVSLAWVFLGIEMNVEDERLLVLASRLDDQKKRSLLDLLGAQQNTHL
jgi:hypothetical protein